MSEPTPRKQDLKPTKLMDIEKYDFESALEQGFKTLFDGAGLSLRIPDDIGQGELPDECLTLEIDAGGPISDEHQNAAGEYDNYSGTFTVEINTPRVPNDQTAAVPIQQVAIDAYVVSGAGTVEANGLYVSDGLVSYQKLGSDGSAEYIISREVISGTWVIGRTSDDAVMYAQTSSPQSTPPETGWVSSYGEDPAPTLSIANAQSGFRNRHRELVATARKALEEIDAAALTANWPGALSPTKITPSGTDRENDKDSQSTTLSYALQFRIA